jgi:hypothetical protein
MLFDVFYDKEGEPVCSNWSGSCYFLKRNIVRENNNEKKYYAVCWSPHALGAEHMFEIDSINETVVPDDRCPLHNE